MESQYIILPIKKFSKSDENLLEISVTNLANSINLNGNWEVALTEISYTKTWLNIPSNQTVELLVFNKDKENFYEVISDPNAIIAKGEYTVEKLENEITIKTGYLFDTYDGEYYIKGHADKKVTFKPKIFIHPQNSENGVQSLGVINNNEIFFVRMSEDLGTAFGLSYHDITRIAKNQFNKYAGMKKLAPHRELPIESTDWRVIEVWSTDGLGRKADLKNFLKYFYITTDIVKPTMVGKDEMNLLRIINIPSNSKYGELIHESFNNLQYYPLKKNKFENISITVMQNKFEALPFVYGELLFTLHFRPLKHLNELGNTSITVQKTVTLIKSDINTPIIDESIKTEQVIKETPVESVEQVKPLIETRNEDSDAKQSENKENDQIKPKIDLEDDHPLANRS